MSLVVDRPNSFLIFGGHRIVRHYNTLYRHHPCFCFHKNEHARIHGNGDDTDILPSIKEYLPTIIKDSIWWNMGNQKIYIGSKVDV